MDSASFFFSFEFDLPGTALRLLSGRAPEVATRLRKKTLAAPVFIVQNESCLLSNDSPWHHSRSGRNWPDMWSFWKMTVRGRGPADEVRKRRFQPGNQTSGPRPCESLRDLSGICPIFAIALLPLTVWRRSGWCLVRCRLESTEEGCSGIGVSHFPLDSAKFLG